MPDVYLEVPVTTDVTTLADQAIAALQARWPGWEPNDGDLEVVMIETIAAMAADAAETASQVPSAIFDAFGQAYAGITRLSGSYAVAALTFTLADTDGQTIPAGTEVEIDGFVFATDDDQTAAAAATEIAAVAATAMELGIEANNLPGDLVTPITSLARVDTIALDDPTTGGADPETDDEYLDRLSLAMELHGTTLVTTHDFELLAVTLGHAHRAVATHLGARAVRFVGIDADGNNLSAGVKTTLDVLFAQFRMVNTTVTIEDPTRTTVTVTYAVTAYPEYDTAELETTINAMLADLIHPLNWGVPTSTIPSAGDDVPHPRWYNEPRVRVNKLIDKIGNVQGVDFVSSVSLATSTTRAITIEADDDKVTLAAHGFVANQPIQFPALTGGAGLSINTTYFVRDVEATKFKVAATSGGAVIDVTTDATAGTVKPVAETNGDLVLPGNTPLPESGTHDGTIT